MNSWLLQRTVEIGTYCVSNKNSTQSFISVQHEIIFIVATKCSVSIYFLPDDVIYRLHSPIWISVLFPKNSNITTSNKLLVLKHVNTINQT